MHRKLLALLLALILAFGGLTACGENGGNGNMPSEGQTDGGNNDADGDRDDDGGDDGDDD